MRRRQTAERLKPAAFEECRGCSCPSEEPCRVERLVNRVLFVHAAHAFLCRNRTSFGDSYICRCTARRDIFQRTGL
jgi:hypothetical protein